MNPGFSEFLAATPQDRRDVFLSAAARLGTPEQNVEKDVCVTWTLDVLFNGLPVGHPTISLQRRNVALESLRPDITIFRRHRSPYFGRTLAREASVQELANMTERGARRGSMQSRTPAAITYSTGLPGNRDMAGGFSGVAGGSAGCLCSGRLVETFDERQKKLSLPGEHRSANPLQGGLSRRLGSSLHREGSRDLGSLVAQVHTRVDSSGRLVTPCRIVARDECVRDVPAWSIM
jgi:hypothetical protein